ncbi:MAG: phosphomannomutase/phosphoglucomutase [Candidatus Daviesbacteria bacterium]|nr:phosphomannomutase/phosphoglucomutase [Candidatus Daviesbacteria bacterium]
MDVPPENIFKSYDIRGIYPEEINEEFAVPITRAIYKLLSDQLSLTKPLTIAVGRDMRLSSPAIFEAVSKTLIGLGAEVIDLGIVSTPTFYFAVFKNGYDGGIQITASHNPKQYNGLKIVRRSPTGLVKIGKNTGMEDIKKLSREGVEIISRGEGSITKKGDILEEEVQNALRIAGFPEIKKFKLVADAANALGALYIDALFKAIPGELIKMNFELDGTFPAHQADPLQSETLVELQKKVKEEKADLGLAPDGDGDRLFFIDEKGAVIQPSLITSLVAKELLTEKKGETILFDIRYILTPKKIVEEYQGKYEITKVGHAFITEKMHETGAIFAGESSAHYFFRETGNAESQLPMILIVLKVMSREGKPLSEIIEDLKRSHESGETNFKVKNALEIIEALKEKYSDAEISTLDGVAVSYKDWRFSLRSSNTEPLLRLNIEHVGKEALEDKKQELLAEIEKHATFEDLPK